MRTWKFLIAAACCGLLIAPLAFGQTVVITEVMYDDTASTDLEWVEIHNTTGAPIDISGWALTDDDTYPVPSGEGFITVPAGTVLPADGYLVLSRLAIPEFAGEVVCAQTGSWTLGNSGDNLALFDAAGNLVDGSLTVQFPDLAGANAGNTIEKCDATSGWTNDPAAWHESTFNFASVGRFRHCTPGAENSSCDSDTQPPTLVSVNPGSNPAIDVAFSESLNPATAQTATNYSVNNGIGNPVTAVLQANPAVVRLTFGAVLPPSNYTLTVDNVQDVAGNPIAPNSTIGFAIAGEDLRFTEVMPNPNFVGTADSLGEWFEIYNAGPTAVNLAGWILQDNAGSDTIEAAIINPGQYFVFCSNGDSATNGGVPENYAYEFGTSGWGISLNNTGETLTLRNPAGTPVASMNYTGFPFGAGYSAQLRNFTDDPTAPASWCQPDVIWNGATQGDHGTPGQATICPAPFVPDTLTVCTARLQDDCGVLQRLNERVVTRGVVTYVDTCRPIAYFQSGGCGISIFGTAVTNNMQGLPRRMQPGDSIQVEGHLTQFRGLAEFATFAAFVPVVTYRAAVPVPANAVVPCVDISDNGAACAGEAFESRLVRVEGVTFANAGGTFSHGDSNYVATCGANTIYFRVDSCDATLGQPIPAGPVTIDAILSQYDTSSCYCQSYQLVYSGQPFVGGPCADPAGLTVYRTAYNPTHENVTLRWQPGDGQACNNYKIYYATTGDAAFPNGYTYLTCVTGTTTFTDTAPATPRRFYVVTADGSCP